MNKVQTNTRKQMSMTDYVQYRNGVPLGASGSLQHMLVRSLGAGTFAKFWQYWNPIWGDTEATIYILFDRIARIAHK